MKLTEAEVIGALQDVFDNYGMMSRTERYKLEMCWSELKERGLVGWDPWSKRYLPTDAGLAALAKAEDAPS